MSPVDFRKLPNGVRVEYTRRPKLEVVDPPKPVERPILFLPHLVAKILAGEKTQTRRLVRPTLRGCTLGAYTSGSEVELVNVAHGDPVDAPSIVCPFGSPGDRLWVRETWWHYRSAELEQAGFVGGTVCHIFAGGAGHYQPNPQFDPESHPHIWTKRPSIHMPRWASRLMLEVTSVRAERLQEISESDALAEGMKNDDDIPPSFRSCRAQFQHTWDAINGTRAAWFENPWVWVVGFTRIEVCPPTLRTGESPRIESDLPIGVNARRAMVGLPPLGANHDHVNGQRCTRYCPACDRGDLG